MGRCVRVCVTYMISDSNTCFNKLFYSTGTHLRYIHVHVHTSLCTLHSSFSVVMVMQCKRNQTNEVILVVA